MSSRFSQRTTRAYHPTVKLNTSQSNGVITHGSVTTPTSPVQAYTLGLVDCHHLRDETTLEMKRDDIPPTETWPSSLYGRILDVHWPIPNLGTTPITVRIAAFDVCTSATNAPAVDVTVRYPTGNMVRAVVKREVNQPIQLLDFYQATLAPGSVWNARFQVLINGPGEGAVGLAAFVLD